MEFGSILFHRLSEGFSEKEKHLLLADLEKVLCSYGAELNEYEFAGFSKTEFPIMKCSSCQLLTLDSDVNPDGFDSGDIYDGINRVIKTGKIIDGEIYCNECIQLSGT